MKIKHKILLVVLPVVVVSILAILAIALNNFFVSTKNEIIDKLKLTSENIVDKIKSDVRESGRYKVPLWQQLTLRS